MVRRPGPYIAVGTGHLTAAKPTNPLPTTTSGLLESRPLVLRHNTLADSCNGILFSHYGNRLRPIYGSLIKTPQTELENEFKGRGNI